MIQAQAKVQTSAPTFRRRFPRRQFRYSVGVLARGEYNVVSGLEIGEGGLLFQTTLELIKDSDVVLNFFVPGRSFISVRGLIVYSLPDSANKGEKRSYGIKFHSLAFEYKRVIRDYIAEKTSQEAPV